MEQAVNFPVLMDHMVSTVLPLVSARMEQTVHPLMAHAVALLGGLGNHVMIHAHLDHMGQSVESSVSVRMAPIVSQQMDLVTVQGGGVDSTVKDVGHKTN